MAMKKIMLVLAAAAVIFSGCTDILGGADLEKLDEMTAKVNSDLTAVQNLVKALNDNNYVTNFTPKKEDGVDVGYTVVFNGGRRVTVIPGDLGSCPALAAAADDDGLYYWTVDGGWLTGADGGKLLVKGQDKKAGREGVVLQTKIEDGFWYVSSDAGGSWMKLGEAKADDGVSLFKGMENDDDNVYFMFHDGTELKASRHGILDISFDMELPLAIDPDSAIEVGYTVQASAKKTTVNVESTSDLVAEAVADDMFSGKIKIQSGPIVDAESQVVVTVSDGENTIEKILNFVPTAPVFELSPKEVAVSAKGGNFEITVLTNIGYEISGMSDWLSEVEVRDGEQPHTVVHVFKAEANPTEEERRGMVSLCNDNQVCLAVPVVQKAKVPTDGKSFHHRSVAMRFTADWCGYCPHMASALEIASENMGDRLEVISVHGDGALYFDQSGYLASQYLIDGYPTGIVDGRRKVENYADQNYIAQLVDEFSLETEDTYSTSGGIAFSSSVDGRNVSVSVEAYLKLADSYKITALLVEDAVVARQADYTNGTQNDYVHNGVARIALSNVLGDGFETTSPDDVKEFSYSAAVPEKYNLDNMRVVVYIQRAFGSQEKIQSGRYGDYYIDNSASGKVGEKVDLKFAE